MLADYISVSVHEDHNTIILLELPRRTEIVTEEIDGSGWSETSNAI